MSSLRWRPDVDVWENKMSAELNLVSLFLAAHITVIFKWVFLFYTCKTTIFIEYFYRSTAKFKMLKM